MLFGLCFLGLFLLIADRFPPQGRALRLPEFHILYFLPPERDLLSQIVVKNPVGGL